MKCILYARVSTDKQAEKELSIPAQLQAMRDFARQHGWSITEEFLEPGVSARTAERPALQQLLAACRSDSKPDVVLVHKIDRLARNVFDHATIRALFKQRDIRLASVVENVDETVSGELVENIMASIAQFYSGNLSEEVKKGMRQKVLNGGWPHLPPRGYILVRSDTGPARVEPHPMEGPAIVRAFERYATGWYSLKRLALLLATDGITSSTGRPWSPSQIHRTLTNPFYLGRLKWRDLTVPGSHTRLISADLFERVGRVLSQRFKDPGAKGSVRGFPLRGLAICASCRGHMTAGVHKRRFLYYRCSRHSYDKTRCAARSYCPAHKAAKQVQKLCSGLTLAGDIAGAIRNEAERQIQKRVELNDAQVRALRMKRTRLAEKELRLTETFISGEVAPDAYKAASRRLSSDIQALEARLARVTLKPTDVLARVDEVLARAVSVQELHDELAETQQVELLRAVFKTIVLDETGMVGFTLRSPFATLFTKGTGRVGDLRGLTAISQNLLAEVMPTAEGVGMTSPAA